MRQWIGICILILLAGCGGGTSEPNRFDLDPHEVDERAFEYAVDSALSEVDVTCEEVLCPTADIETPVRNGISQQHVCQFNCITVIDDTGRLRQYYLAFLWDRLAPVCFDEFEVEIWAWGEHVYGCDPHVAQ